MNKTGRLPKEFLWINVNPNGNKVNDCVVRAIAYASGKTWHEVFGLLCETAGKKAMMPNDPDVYSVILESLGFVKQTIAAPKKGGKRKCESCKHYRWFGEYAMMVCQKHGEVDSLGACKDYEQKEGEE